MDTMSETEPRPLWLAGLAGWLGQAAIAWLLLIVGRERYIAELDEGHMFEGDGNEAFARPAAMLTSGWFGDVAILYLNSALFALPGALLLVLAMLFAERRAGKPLSAWLLAGAAAALPIAGYVLIAFSGGPAPPSPGALLGHAFVPIALGMLGAAIAWQVRHRRGWR